jgi:hypothetical protein
MTGGIAGFGGAGYSKPQARALSSIASTPDPDTSSQDKLVRLLQQHSSQIRFLAANQKQLQQGVNDATANPVQQVQQFIADIIVLLGGGQLAEGLLDFGDLQYFLPALGALFGFDADSPFPISLFDAAEKFFLGYVVPNAQFADVVNKIIEEWAKVFGIDPEFIRDVKSLITAFGDLFDGLQNLLPSLNELFSALGITGADLGPLGQVLGPIIKLFSGIDLTDFGNAVEFITDAVDPFIRQLTAIINWVNAILRVFGIDDVVNSPLGDTQSPFELINNLFGFIEGLFNRSNARLAKLEAKLNTALKFSDNCSTLDNISNVAGTVALTGWGAITAAATAVWVYDLSPDTDKQGAGIHVKNKRPGVTGVDICSNDGRTSFCRLRLTSTKDGVDNVAVVTGTGPTSGIITRMDLDVEIPTDTFWEICYEPYDEESPTSNTFHVYMNGKEVVPLRWRDDGNVVLHGAGYRRQGGLLNGANNSKDRGFDVTDITGYDWTAAPPQ